MAQDLNQAMIECLRRLLRPVIRFCLKRSLNIQTLIETAKVEYVQMAAAEMQAAGKKVNVSRLSAATGLRRKEIDRVLEGRVADEGKFGFAPRVISYWRRDSRFVTKGNQPRVLTCKGNESEFGDLVKCVSSDIHPRAVLEDLERLGVVEISESGVRLKAKAYRPEPDTVDSFMMLGADVDDLVNAVLENFSADQTDLPNYHARTFFDNVSDEDLPKIRKWLYAQCSRFQLKAEKYLAGYDLDLNPKLKEKKKGGSRVSLGLFTKT